MLGQLQVNSIDKFKAYLVEQDRADHTINGYLQDLKRFSVWFTQTNGETLAPELLTATDVRLYRQYLQLVQKAKPATINRKLAALRTFAQSACANGELESNPILGVKGIKTQETAPRWLDRRQQAALMRVLERAVMATKTSAGKRQAIRDQAIVILLLNTGLRIGELCALELEDITISERKGELRVRNGKGGKARTIPLNKTAIHAINAWLEVRPDQEGGELFIGKRGQKLEASGIQRRIHDLGARARAIQRRVKDIASQMGEEGITPHTLRHSFAKNLVDAGVSIEKVAALLGHEDINTTRIYITPGQVDLRNAVELLDN